MEILRQFIDAVEAKFFELQEKSVRRIICPHHPKAACASHSFGILLSLCERAQMSLTTGKDLEVGDVKRSVSQLLRIFEMAEDVDTSNLCKQADEWLKQTLERIWRKQAISQEFLEEVRRNSGRK
jgi:histidinol phosphatase-like enzyme